MKPIALAAFLIVALQTASAEDHKAWMNDASDAQEDFRDAMAAKSATKVGDAGAKLGDLMQKTLDYWQAKKAADGVKLTQDCIAQARAIQAAAKANRLSDAQTAFEKMTTACNACHALHLEKR